MQEQTVEEAYAGCGKVGDMKYDSNSRKRWEKSKLEAWNKEHQDEIDQLSDEQRALFDEIHHFSELSLYNSDIPAIRKWGHEQTKAAYGARSLREIIQEGCSEIVDILVPLEYQEDFYYLLDQYAYFQYTRSSFRPTLRTVDLSLHIQDAFGLMQAYKVLSIYDLTPPEYLTSRKETAQGTLSEEEVDPELLDFILKDIYSRELRMVQFDDILAARIDRNDTVVIDAIQDAFLSDNNTVVVTVPLIRGVLKSKSTKLHELLAQFLVAARLQEGVRQAVCENADCGRAEAFLVILKAIQDNDLLRFSAVKRAIATWTGICNTESMDRISAKLLDDIIAAIRDRSLAMEMTQTDDSMKIITGLWALGFYEAQDAINRMLEIVTTGTRNQRLTISYYNRYLQKSSYSNRTAKKMIETYPDDPQIAAAFMPTYFSDVQYIITDCIVNTTDTYIDDAREKDLKYTSLPLKKLFGSEEEARRHFAILKGLADNMKTRQIAYAPLIFPWYGVTLDKSDLTQRMAMIAYALQDQDLIDEVCMRLSDITVVYSYYNPRYNFLRILLHDPKTQTQKNALLDYVTDRETRTRNCAWKILKEIQLTDDDIERLESHLRFKNEEIRKNVIDLLDQQDEAKATMSIQRLLSSDKELYRLAGLDMLQRRGAASAEAKEAATALLLEILPDADGLTEKEKVLYQEIAGNMGSVDVLNMPGYGLYNPMATYEPSLLDPAEGEELLKSFFNLSAEEQDRYFDMIRSFIVEHGKLEYTNAGGEKELLENRLSAINNNWLDDLWTRYPFPELWDEVYDTIIKDPNVFLNLYYAILLGHDTRALQEFEAYQNAEETILGNASSSYHYADEKYNGDRFGNRMYQKILEIISSKRGLELPVEVARAAVLMATRLPEEIRWIEEVPRPGRLNGARNVCFLASDKFRALLARARRFDGDDEFRTIFPLLYEVDRVYQFDEHGTSAYSRSSHNELTVLSYIKAYELGIITKDFLYKSVFESVGLRYAIGSLGDIFAPKLTIGIVNGLRPYMPVDAANHTVDTDCRFYQICAEVYENLINLVLDVELVRGDTPTVFSEAVSRIPRIEGISRLMQILRALGSDPLDRSTHYLYETRTGKRDCLSHLLKVCYPLPTETAADFTQAVKENGISKARLIEAAIYAPQWLDFAEEALGMEGLKSGCYYFMAHTSEHLDEYKQAVIARYTPLTSEELYNGCFDTNWFFEVYEKLGEKNFALLYKAAKYVADGAKHTRARKYADAATGKVERDELEKTISSKRNKDLLMSYGLIPMKDRQDALHRYEFLQNFLKESKQFGAQRRQSEAKCVQYALKNMATTMGYADDTRLVLAMETELVKHKREFFDEVEIAGYIARIMVDVDGKPNLVLRKGEGGKALKTVPAALRKDEAFGEVKDFSEKLKNQYARCVAMFERSMAEEEAYGYGELLALCENPVLAGILGSLVFVGKDTGEGAQLNDGARVVGTLDELAAASPTLDEQAQLCVAHPITLFKLGELARYQRVFFDRQMETGTKQPFKQVFREFYPKLDEEKDASDSRLFAGYQIQPKKTVATLRGRGWVADFDGSLQKVFFRQDVAATIYALADWFSPADTESPTIEYVSFYDRKTYQQKKISDVPDILYSEVMRDVDLVVSVAHVGGVDPETSHSTIEMRRVICAFNMELFGLTNVSFEGSHAFIKGTYDTYNVQLGSGVIHRERGGMVNIVPVHSQQRGKLFLPFIDDDPKTAEILSKIILLAEDDKIKDPYILSQIQ